MARSLQLLAVAVLAFAAGVYVGQRHPLPDISAGGSPEPESEPPATAAPEPAAEAGPPAAPPGPSFPFPADLGGKAVAKTVTPAAPPPLPLPGDDQPATGKGPRPLRANPRTDPDLVGKPAYTPPPVRLPAPPAMKPAAPPERVPFDLGARPTPVPSAVVFAETSPQTARARDVAVPPNLPVLARPLPNRTPVEDPTADAGNAEIVARTVPVVPAAAPFLKVALPDPFEFADQVRPNLPPGTEPPPAPVPVPPQRPR